MGAARVALARAMSIVLLVTSLWGLAAGAARAHEVLPAIADLEATGDRITLDIEAAVEGWLAGIDLSEVTDTNEAAEAGTYDALRALEPDVIAVVVALSWDAIAARESSRS